MIRSFRWHVLLPAVFAAVVTVAVWPLAASRFAGAGSSPPPVLEAPPPAEGWQPVAGHLTAWTPRFLNPGAKINQAYAVDARRVGLYIGYYRNQRQGAELITSRNTLVPSNDRAWANIGETRHTLIFNNEKVSLIEAKLRSPTAHLLVWRWYWVDGVYTVNPYWAKLLQAKSKLFGTGDDGAVVIVYTELDADGKMAAGRLQEFVTTMLPGITRSLDHAR